MTNKIFRATLVTNPEEIREARINLDGKLENGTLETFSDLGNFEYLLKHTSAAYSDVYMLSRLYTALESGDPDYFHHLIVKIKAATDKVRNNPLILSYNGFDEFSEEDKSIDIPDGAIISIPTYRNQTGIYSPSFYASLAHLLNDKDFREGIRTRDPRTLGEAEAGHSILTLNPGRVKSIQTPLI